MSGGMVVSGGVAVGAVGAVVLVTLAVALLGVLVLSARLVGHVAEEFGEDRVKWQLMMLPFGPFGPLIARAVLTSRSGRGGGPGNFA